MELIGWWLKKRVPYFKVTEIIHRKFENFVILPSRYLALYISKLPRFFFHFFIVFIPVPYAFYFSYG